MELVSNPSVGSILSKQEGGIFPEISTQVLIRSILIAIKHMHD